MQEAERVAADLNRLADEGLAAGQVATVVRALAAGQRKIESVGNRIDLVFTGPDSAAASRDTAVVVDELFSSALSSVLVVGFVLFNGRKILLRLAERFDALRSLDVTLCLDVSRHPGDSSRE